MDKESVDHIEKTEEVRTGPGEGEPPVEDFDELSVQEAMARIDSLSREELEQVKSYEQAHKNRKTLVEHLNKKIASEEREEGGRTAEEGESWFASYRSWILAGIGAGAVAIFWLLL